jgi:hypothetical protein
MFSRRRILIGTGMATLMVTLFSMSSIAEKEISSHDLSLRLTKYRAVPFTRWRISGRQISELHTNLSAFLISKGFVNKNESLRTAKFVKVYSTGPLVDEGETWFYSMDRCLYGSGSEYMLLHWSESQPDLAAVQWRSIMSRLEVSDWNAAMKEILLLRVMAIKETGSGSGGTP